MTRISSHLACVCVSFSAPVPVFRKSLILLMSGGVYLSSYTTYRRAPLGAAPRPIRESAARWQAWLRIAAGDERVMTMSDGSKLIKATGLWRKTSAAGNEYLTGRLGGLRVLIMPNKGKATDADPSHVLLIGEAGERAPKPTGTEGGR